MVTSAFGSPESTRVSPTLGPWPKRRGSHNASMRESLRRRDNCILRYWGSQISSESRNARKVAELARMAAFRAAAGPPFSCLMYLILSR